MLSPFAVRVLKATAFAGLAYVLLPRLRDMVFHRLQPILMRRVHKAVLSEKESIFHMLKDYKEKHGEQGESLRIIEIGAADGLNLGYYPAGSRIVVIEPADVYRAAFERNLAEVNRSIGPATAEHDLVPACTILEAWYPIPVEQLDAIRAAGDGPGPSPPSDWSIGKFDAAVSTFTLCSVKDLELSLRVLTTLVKPGGLLIMLEHIEPPSRLSQLLCMLIEPMWKWLSCGCHLRRQPDRVIQSMNVLVQTWDVLVCRRFDMANTGKLSLVRRCVALVARRRPVPSET